MPGQTDSEFEHELKAYLAQYSEGQEPAVPVMLNDDGTINREKTLALECYLGFSQDKS
jgi:hypothetical protein